MKRIILFRNVFMMGAAVCSLAVVSCKKEAGVPDVTNADASAASSGSVQNNTVANSFSPYKVLGLYSLRGSRTKYRGQANDAGDNITLSLDYFGERTVETSRDKKALTCGYGEPNYTNMGWKYVIRYNPATREVLLSPNDTMERAIAPNSFETLYAAYDPTFHSFTFQTRFTDKDGNESEVVDLLNKE